MKTEIRMSAAPGNYLTHLECANCATTYPTDREQHLCTCGGILLARYDLDRMRAEVPLDRVTSRPWNDGLWRYSEMLPLSNVGARTSLGEGATPLLSLDWLSRELGIQATMKDEGLNPTGTFKSRGAAVGVSMAKALGVQTIA